MPLYELFCISRASIPKEQNKNLIRKAALLVMVDGGVVRKFDNFGENKLAYNMRKNQEWFNRGRQWTMQFHAPSSSIQKLDHQMKLDPTVIRHGITKLSNSFYMKKPVDHAIITEKMSLDSVDQ